ncbi:hypothetical protein GCM10007863_25950 [Dyella mobilis]|nr:hypothetical protein GCM10007863_25950 [Dyella mobilis]
MPLAVEYFDVRFGLRIQTMKLSRLGGSGRLSSRHKEKKKEKERDTQELKPSKDSYALVTVGREVQKRYRSHQYEPQQEGSA